MRTAIVGLGVTLFLNAFFGIFMTMGIKKRSIRTSLRSGVIIDAQGYVLTNWHVIEKALWSSEDVMGIM